MFKKLSKTNTTAEELLGGGVQVGTELGESSDLTVLGKLKLHGAGDLLHSTGLGGRADTGHGQTDVDGGADTLVEQFSFQENLTVSDGNDVGRNVSRHVSSLKERVNIVNNSSNEDNSSYLGLNNWESSQRATTVVFVHLGSTFKQTRVEVEDVTRVGLTTRGTAKQKRHLTVGDGLLGQIVVDDQGVLAVVAEVFTY